VRQASLESYPTLSLDLILIFKHSVIDHANAWSDVAQKMLLTVRARTVIYSNCS